MRSRGSSLPRPDVLVARRLAAAQRELLDLCPQIGDQRFERRRVGAEFVSSADSALFR